MKVFKFGGASINSLERIKNIANLLSEHQNEKLILIVSAMGKVTNALEKVAEAFYNNKTEEAIKLFEVIKRQHTDVAKYLLVTHYNACLKQIEIIFSKTESLLHTQPQGSFDKYYDQIVSIGELLSSSLLSYYLNEVGIFNKWFDVRNLICTDNNFRDAGIDWNATSKKIMQWKSEQLDNNNPENSAIFISQGFIGSTNKNESTTLGREGSDFTAAIFGNILDAENVTIWKDVEGVMSADPRSFPDAKLIDHLSYNEVIEMAYYGAQVIHPKTIKPLQNKSIPLLVKCFLDSSLPGTIIDQQTVKDLPPIIVVKENQALLHLRSIDFSFVGHKPMSRLYEIFGQIKIWPNLMQTEAISLEICVDDKPEKLSELAEKASVFFDVQIEKGLTLLTIRHYSDDLLNNFLQNKKGILTQKTKDTVQVLFK